MIEEGKLVKYFFVLFQNKYKKRNNANCKRLKFLFTFFVK